MLESSIPNNLTRQGMTSEGLLEIYNELLEKVGPRNWWPADSPFEVIIGAILTQNTAWSNAASAISNLKKKGLLSPEAIHAVSEKRLAAVIRPSGYFNQKAKKIKGFIKYFLDRYDGSINKMRRKDIHVLRLELLEIHGIGPETADAILLYALEKPIFVIDAYTRRILHRHNWHKDKAPYDEMQEFFMNRLPKNVQLFNEYHALLDYVGHNFCRKSPICHECPLQDRLPLGKEIV